MSAIDLHVRIQGQGFPILCLHGHPGSSQSLSVFTNHLSDRFQTYAPDLRGYGRSQVSEAFVMTDHLTDLEALLDRYELDRCLVLGWSLGGIMAMELALKCPQRVSGLILVATAARPWSNHPRTGTWELINTGIAALLNRIRPGWQWNIDTFGQRSLFRYLITQHTPDAYRYLNTEAVPAYLQTSRPADRALSAALKQFYNRLPDVPAIQCPCLVLAGADDRHITAASSQETAKALPKADWHCYPDTAHLFPWEIPTQVLTDIDTWLQHNSQIVQSTTGSRERS